ncbi:MAG: aspartate kinase, partial [Pseudomonadota bacterium]
MKKTTKESNEKPVLVMKFGGTSMASVEVMQQASKLIQAEIERGYHVCVAVSAMSGETNRLIELITQVSPLYDAHEYDTIVSAGEQISAGLLSLVLHQLGIGARSLLGWQIPVKTDHLHAKARIESIETKNIEHCFARDMVAVCAGFQGISARNRITTLGRGGTDTSAVALAAILNARRCDIYTDVDGVYTADPRIVPKARRLSYITHEEMLEMASSGAKVLQYRSVEMAIRHNVNLRVLSTFTPDEGTTVIKESKMLEKMVVSGITRQINEAKITLVGIADKPGISAGIFG